MIFRHVQMISTSQVLVNLYLDGRAQIKWHADDEPLGACISSWSSCCCFAIAIGIDVYDSHIIDECL